MAARGGARLAAVDANLRVLAVFVTQAAGSPRSIAAIDFESTARSANPNVPAAASRADSGSPPMALRKRAVERAGAIGSRALQSRYGPVRISGPLANQLER